MKTEEALKLIDQVCAQVSLSREGHIKVQAALDVLKEAIEKKSVESSSKS